MNIQEKAQAYVLALARQSKFKEVTRPRGANRRKHTSVKWLAEYLYGYSRPRVYNKKETE